MNDLFSQLSSKLAGVPTITSTFSLLIGLSFLVFSILTVWVFLSQRIDKDSHDRFLFWLFGLGLVAFAMFRPAGLARDDLAYTEILKALCPSEGCQQGTQIVRDYVWYAMVKAGLFLWPGGLRLALLFSGLGVLIKLYVIDQLCRDRLLAMLLLIPLCYLQYDLTQLRAGFALSWMMVGVYFLVRTKKILGAAVLFSNFTVHSQAIFSPGLLAYRLFNWLRWLLPVGSVLLLLLIYLGLHPSPATLAWLGVMPETASYYQEMKAGGFSGVKVFPWAYLLILGYGIWCCTTAQSEERTLASIASAGLMTGLLVAWFFVVVPTIQTRVFEFYSVLLVLLAGNARGSRTMMLMTVALALILYLRIELIHDWILG